MPPVKTKTKAKAKANGRQPGQGDETLGKKFATKDSMLSILDQVSQVEESKVDKKLQRQKTIRKLLDEKDTRATEKKNKKSGRFERLKSQLRQGHSLNPLAPSAAKPAKKKAKSKKQATPKRTPGRTLSSVNREWSSVFDDDDDDSSSDERRSDSPAGSGIAPKKRVTFAV
ncbi:hypothetical protein GGF46_000441 [Coemansia sp. RSA 552]|nr:hypothetical protein GGF46_000441 [Coemansia sp. RSA 552]